MRKFYKTQYEFYSSYCLGKTIYERNGFDEYPETAYSIFISAIETLPEKSLTIIDIGCGNASLLKYIISYTKKKIIPFGVDFLSASIKEAQSYILPLFSNNFLCVNAIDYIWKRSFDIVLFDPSILAKDDINTFFQRIKLSKSHYCIVYVYSDAIRMLKIANIVEILPSFVSDKNILYVTQTEQISLVLFHL
ncbi:MAG: class I SAM-dependent methyltransferase [Paludibacteraceae bacterium]|nr:class I SAM-dependent methyltransferase [Paludibacteraceae bacterium]